MSIGQDGSLGDYFPSDFPNESRPRCAANGGGCRKTFADAKAAFL